MATILHASTVGNAAMVDQLLRTLINWCRVFWSNIPVGQKTDIPPGSGLSNVTEEYNIILVLYTVLLLVIPP